MFCPVCSTVMQSKSKIEDGIYMDLHCFNDCCPTTAIRYRPHVRVVLSKSKAPWRCVAYHLPFKDRDNGGYGRRSDIWYILEGQEGGETMVSVRDDYFETEKVLPEETDSDNEVHTKNTVYSRENTFLVSVNEFMRISTGDKMHEEAKKVFEKLNNLPDILYNDYSSEYSRGGGMCGYYGDYDY